MHLSALSILLLIASQFEYGLTSPIIAAHAPSSIGKRESLALADHLTDVPLHNVMMTRSNEVHNIEKRWFGIIAEIGSKIIGTALHGFFVGMGNIFAVAGGIQNAIDNVGLLDAALEGVWSIWSAEFVPIELRRSDSTFSGHPVLAVHTRTSPKVGGKPHTWTRIDAHIHVGEYSLQKAAVLSHQNDSWLDIATLYADNIATFRISYRLAHPSDLGRENNGTYHHVRATSLSSNNGTQKRAEASDGGVVVDYLWNSGEEQIWDDVYYDTSDADGLAASALSQYMWDYSSEVSCASVFETWQGESADADNGLVGFGWNGQPFGWDGNAAGWVDDCYYPQIF